MDSLIIIGIGMGNLKYITRYAEEKIKESDIIVITSERFKNICNIFEKKIIVADLINIYDIIGKLNVNISVIVSGDAGFYSLSNKIFESFKAKKNVEIINGINSMQYLSSKIHKSYDKWKVLTVHGRENYKIIAMTAYNKYLFLLAGGKNRPENICSMLCEYGLENVEVTVGENLSYENEKIITDSAYNISKLKFESLSVILIENKNFINPFINLCDSDFLRDNIPMTKQSVRDLSVSLLNIEPEDIIYDIGAGTGSISLACAKKAFEGIVYSIEKEKKACDLINENKIKNKIYNIKIINEKAPFKQNNILSPKKVFIGGSDGNIFEIIDWIKNLNNKIKIVINCITIENLYKSIECLENAEFENVDIKCINCSNGKKVGKYNLMIAENPIYIISGEYYDKK